MHHNSRKWYSNGGETYLGKRITRAAQISCNFRHAARNKFIYYFRNFPFDLFFFFSGDYSIIDSLTCIKESVNCL